MGSRRKFLDEKLENVCSRFTIREISNFLVPLLPNISWKKLNNGIQTYKLKLSSRNLGKLLVRLLKNEKDEKLRHIVNRIRLLDVGLHLSNVWIPYSLIEPILLKRVQTTEELERLILQAIRIEKMNGNIYATRIGGFFYVMIVFKKLTRTKGVVLTPPLYFGVSAEEPYLFVMRNQISEKTSQFIVKALGYEKYKKHSRLSGKNIQSLQQLLKNKAEELKQPEDIPFSPIEYCGHRSRAYVENEERLKHATHFLGKDTIMLEELSVSSSCEFKGDYEEFLEKDFNTAMRIKSQNVGQLIKYLAWKGAIRPPFPDYIKKLNVIGKNKITLKSNN
ncbi:uncharacterized protein LOC142334262 [Lycorma delicatula]|uniref:uncharacterized protein LOC142334262 n=1 Tax=Lycorma delicatula TaxID=130591 RepID=UPI003F512D3A